MVQSIRKSQRLEMNQIFINVIDVIVFIHASVKYLTNMLVKLETRAYGRCLKKYVTFVQDDCDFDASGMPSRIFTVFSHYAFKTMPVQCDDNKKGWCTLYNGDQVIAKQQTIDVCLMSANKNKCYIAVFNESIDMTNIVMSLIGSLSAANSVTLAELLMTHVLSSSDVKNTELLQSILIGNRNARLEITDIEDCNAFSFGLDDVVALF